MAETNKDKQNRLLDTANTQFKYIVNNSADGCKFDNLGVEIHKLSKALKKEFIKKQSKSTSYTRYKYGMLVLVDFGLGLDGELSKRHFAIVLNRHDNPLNSTLTVVPLSSKNNKNRLSIGTFISETATKIIDEFKEELENLKNAEPTIIIDDIPDENGIASNEVITLYSDVADGLKEIEKIIHIYKTKNKISYALINQITTISKLKVVKPINRYDPIQKLLVPKDIMEKIESEIQKFL